MLLIDHYIDRSPIHGLGVFAAEAVPKGAVVWKFDPLLDIVVAEADLARLPAHVVRNIQMRGEWLPERRCFVLGSDGDAFMNHSDRPNFASCGDHAVALADISVGDELTWNYREFRVLAFDPSTLHSAVE